MGLLTLCFVPRGGFLYTMIVPGGGFLFPSSRVPGGWFWMKLIPALVGVTKNGKDTPEHSCRYELMDRENASN